DPAMRRFIGGIDREQNHHGHAGGDRDIGRLGHVAAGGRGCEFCQTRENKRLGHCEAESVGKKPGCGVLRAAGPTKCPGGGSPSTTARKQRYRRGGGNSALLKSELLAGISHNPWQNVAFHPYIKDSPRPL